MFAIPKYQDSISLIPGGCPQFLDYEAPLSILDDVKYAFQEDKVVDNDGKKKVVLRAFRKNDDKEFADEINPDMLYSGYGYEMSGLKELEPWIGEWLPLPFLRCREQNWPGSNDCRFEYGPTNWARGRLVYSPDNEGFLRLVLAFDMQVEEKTQNIYAALSPDDVDANAHFRLAWRFRDNSWYLDLPWVEEWLRETWEKWRKKSRKKIQEDDPKFTYLASYLTFLEVIQRVSKQCHVYVVRPDASPCINVDLVLDIGNSRTTGMLVETQVQTVTNLNDSYLLQLRDMNKPEMVYTDPFDTRLEFSEIYFGNDALSRRSGRRTSAFAWAAPGRIGPEATRLATRSRSGKGTTGMSSPKRYLWDERDWKASWRYNSSSDQSLYVTRGPLVQNVNSSGTPLCCMDDPLFLRNPILRKQEKESAFESYFTRSSLMMFLLVEIIQQALLTINSPGQRYRGVQHDKPRRLRQIIFTVPAGMPKAEQKIYVRWAKWAVAVLWEALGWSEYYVSQKTRLTQAEEADYRTSPQVRCNWDEATCTQLVYIYNEITRQFQGDASLFFELAGRERGFDGHSAPSIRIAAIDIGGGTTDLSITTFELAGGKRSTPRIVPHPNFHDGFNLAGDDILKAVIADHLLSQLGNELIKSGVPNAQNALATLFGREVMNSSAETRNQKIQFIRQIAVPVGISLLGLYEKADLQKENAKIKFKLADCFKISPEQGEQSDQESPNPGEQDKSSRPLANFTRPGAIPLNYVKNYLAENGLNSDFDILEMEIVMDPKAIDETVRRVLGDILTKLCEVINRYDCDALLLTGRPSCWPGVIDKIYSLVPLPPGKIYPMADYNVGNWYPFSDALGNVTDPKTTVVVGAILCALAEGHLEGFSFDSRNLSLMSTARYIGEMELNGQIKRDKVWFTVDPEKNTVESNADVKEKAASKRDKNSAVAEISFGGPIAVGFRQLETERWTTSRYYLLDYTDETAQAKATAELPLQIKLQLSLQEDEEKDEGEFEIIEVMGSQQNDLTRTLEMRLQTLPREDGFWMDTGIVYDS